MNAMLCGVGLMLEAFHKQNERLTENSHFLGKKSHRVKFLLHWWFCS
jgi:hypothetical protein